MTRLPSETPALQVAVLQGAGAAGAVAVNLAALEAACAGSAAAGDALLVTPELWLTGFNIGNDARRLACTRDAPEIAALRDMAGRHRLSLCVGYPERDGDAVYNAAVLIDGTGAVLGHYRKHRLSGDYENATFNRGDGTDLVAPVGGIRTGVLICYDMEFPENVRRLALAGVKLLLVPTALSLEFAFVAEKLVPTRAFENGIFVAYADLCGVERGKRYAGQSCIVGPDGADLARAGAGPATVRARVEPARFSHLDDRLPYLRDLAAG